MQHAEVVRYVMIPSDREKNSMEDANTDMGSDSQVPKRPRIIRNRYVTGPQAHGLAKKLLPIDPGANDKRPGRKDYG